MKTWYADLYEDGQIISRIDCDNEDQARQAVADWQKPLPDRRSGQYGPIKPPKG